ncbi:MAG: acyloxyacyl hydrolase [Hyphomicrobium sp.]|jgi:hypothetical protein
MPLHFRSRAVVILVASLLCSSAAIAGSLVHELKLGVLDHDVPGLWSGFRAEPDQADINLEAILSPSLPILGGQIRPAVGGSINPDGATSNAYIDARWQYETRGGFFLGLGIGGAVHDGQLKLQALDEKALGSRVLFHFPLEIGYRLDAHNSVSAYFEHISNGYTASPNEGLDRLGIRYGFRLDPN